MKWMIFLLVLAVGGGLAVTASAADPCACKVDKSSVSSLERAGSQVGREDLPRRANRDWQ